MNYSKLATKKGASYAEILKTKITSTMIETNNRLIKEFSTGERTMHAVRLLYKGAWGTAYSHGPEYAKLITKAIKNAKTIKHKTRIKSLKPARRFIDAEYADDPRDVEIGNKKAMLLSLDRKTEKIKTLNLNYADKFAENQFENSEGSSITQRNATIGLFSTAYAKQGSRTERYTSILRKRAGYELMAEAPKTVQESMQKAEQMLKAKHPKGGTSPTIIDQYIAGVFAHEAVGHACEADIILNESSILAGKTGKRIGNENVTIFDDGDINEWGYTPVDSEGAKATHTVLINKGVLQDLMHNRETAAKFRTAPTGNGRSQDPSMKVIPRMTNTVITEGDSSFDEMLAEMKNGYYLKGSAGGQVNTASGDFLFNAQEGYLIEKGKIKHMIKDVSLLGSILDTLHNIRLLAQDTKYDTGYCGKAGQAVPVSSGSPHILLGKAKIGGTK